MKRAFRPVLVPALLALAALAPRAAAQASADAPTVVIVVRHAEKADDSRDPVLSAAGEARARALVGVARDAGVQAVYSSEFQRTRLTGQPTAEALGVAVTPLAVAQGGPAGYPQRVAQHILANDRGKTVLVVSHSNTVPAIVRALGGADVGAITEPEYSHVFVVVIPAGGGPVRTVRATYGAPSGPAAGPPATDARMTPPPPAR